MIKIKQTGNAYRLAQYSYGIDFDLSTRKLEQITNLCPFVRRMLLGALVAFVFIPFVSAFLLIGFLAPIVHLATSLYFWDSGYFWVLTTQFLLGVVLYSFVFLAIMSYVLLEPQSKVHQALVEYFGSRKENNSILYHYAKALKERVCPQIEIVKE